MKLFRELLAKLTRKSPSPRADAEFVYVLIPAPLSPFERGERFEDPLDIELRRAGIGEVSGGGTQLGEDGLQLLAHARGGVMSEPVTNSQRYGSCRERNSRNYRRSKCSSWRRTAHQSRHLCKINAANLHPSHRKNQRHQRQMGA